MKEEYTHPTSNTVINKIIEEQIIKFKDLKPKWNFKKEITINRIFKHYITHYNLFINQSNKRPLTYTTKTVGKKTIKRKINFYHQIDKIPKNPLFKLLSKMPKGGILHCHLEASILFSEFIKYLGKNHSSILSNIYYLKNDKKSLEIHQKYLATLKTIEYQDLYLGSYVSPYPYTLGYFDQGKPHDGWKSLGEIKKNSIEFKRLFMANQMTEYTPGNGFDVLERLFDQSWSLIKHQDIFPHYLENVVEKMIEIKVSHCDFRLYLGSVHSKKLVLERDGFRYYQTYGFGNYRLEFDLLNKILNKNPKVFSASLILCKFRFQLLENQSQFYSMISEIVNGGKKGIQKEVQKVILGFDGFSQEFYNKNNRNRRFNQLIIDDISRIEKDFGIKLKYYPHAGETEDSESLYHKNLTRILDTLPNLKRIGHGIALIKYPILDKIYLEHKIHIELNPLSNYLLGFIGDIRNHPGLTYLRRGHRVSINPDDPAIFGYSSVNYDWYMVATMWELTLNEIYKMCRYSLEDSGLRNRGQIEYNYKFNKWENEFNSWLSDVEKQINKFCGHKSYKRTKTKKQEKTISLETEFLTNPKSNSELCLELH